MCVVFLLLTKAPFTSSSSITGWTNPSIFLSVLFSVSGICDFTQGFFFILLSLFYRMWCHDFYGLTQMVAEAKHPSRWVLLCTTKSVFSYKSCCKSASVHFIRSLGGSLLSIKLIVSKRDTILKIFLLLDTQLPYVSSDIPDMFWSASISVRGVTAVIRC